MKGSKAGQVGGIGSWAFSAERRFGSGLWQFMLLSALFLFVRMRGLRPHTTKPPGTDRQNRRRDLAAAS